MKKNISALITLFIVTTLSGCSINKYNLDLENTKIIENTPTTGEWKKISFDSSFLNERSADRLMQFAENYGLAIDKKDIMMSFNDADLQDVPVSRYKEYYDDKAAADGLEDYPFQCMHYCSDDLYIEIQGPTGGLVELDNRKNVNSVLELDYSYPAPWRPYFWRKSEATVDTNDNSMVCVLNGKTVKIADAIKNAEKYILENDKLFPKEFGAKVLSASLFSYENSENQGLMLNFEYTLDGVVIDGAPSFHIEDENGNSYKCYPIPIQCGMLTENTVDWLWLPAIDGATQYTSMKCKISVSREKACEIIAEKLSREYKFNVKEIELMYAAQNAGSGKSYIEPKWRFYITGIEAQEYGRIYAYVSAVDGTVQISRVMN